jgi:quinol monooxygenase YgiN
MFVTHVRARVYPEKVEAYEAAWRELRAKVLANEPGVLFYELCRDPDVPNGYRVFECYKDQATQDEHLAKDYYQKTLNEVIIHCLVDGTYTMESLETV